jgi:hypothetical protein
MGLEQVSYDWDKIQARAEEILPFGFCNACMTRVKEAESAGQPADPVRAAVTLVAQITTLQAGPGQVAQGLATFPVCAQDIQVQKVSPLALGAMNHQGN